MLGCSKFVPASAHFVADFGILWCAQPYPFVTLCSRGSRTRCQPAAKVSWCVTESTGEFWLPHHLWFCQFCHGLEQREQDVVTQSESTGAVLEGNVRQLKEYR